jgi:hypothetical protein
MGHDPSDSSDSSMRPHPATSNRHIIVISSFNRIIRLSDVPVLPGYVTMFSKKTPPVFSSAFPFRIVKTLPYVCTAIVALELEVAAKDI